MTGLLSRLRPALALLLVLAAPASANVVLDWNDAFIDAVRTNRTNPPVMTRSMAILNVAIYDSVVSLTGGFDTYLVDAGDAPAGANAEAAASAAAHRVLSTVYPLQALTFDGLLAEILAGIPASAARDAGVAWGEEVADAVIASRADDGATTGVLYAPPAGVFWWVATPPAFAPGLLPQWPKVRPWTMVSGSQFRAPGPPVTPNDARYVADYYEVKDLGDTASALRDAEQSDIALFWDDGVGTSTPPGHWNLIAQQLAEERNLSLVETARLFALLGMTVADAAIVSWDSKYHYNHWRPYTGIVNGDGDGNPLTAPDPDWSSYITTPPFPTYTSGHSTFSGSSARVIGLFLGDDAIAFTTGADGTPGVLRSFDSLSQAAEEAGQSRIYGGIHWQYDNRDAIAGGRALAEYVFANFLRPTSDGDGDCVADDATLCLQDGRFAVRVDWRSSPTRAGIAGAVPRTEETGEFTFFDEDNLELLVKVLDACEVNGHYWVFAAAATDVEYIIKVSDAEGGARTYFNPLFTPGRATRDIEAFDCE
ncbi:MAG TPA: vanadium-dependent haloperoxidase [Thermoanaerobaculia bacterium]|nr:vanadium-dependent haloperoxidase [Thermoanaerobaculia bacterium]